MDTLALILSIIGAVNWGLVGICQFDLVAWLFGARQVWSAASSTLWWAWPVSGASVSYSAGTTV